MKPQGVICVLTADDGRVVAHAADFNTGGAAGFTEQERQRIRARLLLAHEFMRSTCNHDVAKSVDTHRANQVMQDVCDMRNWAVTYIPIGYDEDEEAR